MEKNKILENLLFQWENGGLFYQKVRYLLIRPEVLINLQKGIEEQLPEKANALLFQSGFQGGSLSGKRYREVFHLSDHEILKFMIDMGTQIGWGRFQLERFDPMDEVLEVSVHDSPFAEAYGLSRTPVCHFIRGVLSGLASVMMNQEREVEETLCLAKGDPYCLFHLRPQKRKMW